MTEIIASWTDARKRKDDPRIDPAQDMHAALSHLAAAFREIAPDGRFSEEEAVFVQTACDAVDELIDRRRSKGSMARWIRQNDGRLRLDLSADPAPDEAAADASKAAPLYAACAENVAAFKADRPLPHPMGTARNWDAAEAGIHKNHGMTPDQARYLFPTQAHYNRFCDKTGHTQLSRYDAEHPPTKAAGPTKAAMDESVKDHLAKLTAHMKATGQMDAEGNIVQGVRPVPLPDDTDAPGPKRPARKPQNGNSENLDLDALSVADEDVGNLALEIPAGARPNADMNRLNGDLMDLALAKATRRL